MRENILSFIKALAPLLLASLGLVSRPPFLLAALERGSCEAFDVYCLWGTGADTLTVGMVWAGGGGGGLRVD